jgi:hypothetical protein
VIEMMSEASIKRAVRVAHPGATDIGHWDGVVTFKKAGRYYGADLVDIGRGIPAVLRAEELGAWGGDATPHEHDFAPLSANARWDQREIAEPEIDEAGNPIPEVGFWERARPGAAEPAPAVAGRQHDYAMPRPTPGWS